MPGPYTTLLQFAVTYYLSWFGFGGENAGNGLFVDFFFGSHREAAGKLLVADWLGGSQERQKRVDLQRRQGVDDLMQPVQVTHGSTFSVYGDTRKTGRRPASKSPGGAGPRCRKGPPPSVRPNGHVSFVPAACLNVDAGLFL